MQDCICDVMFMWKWGWRHAGWLWLCCSRGCKMQEKLNETMDNAYPINPKKDSGALGYLFCAYWATSGGPNRPRFATHRPTEWTLNNGAPASDSGRENWVSRSDYCACTEPILDLYFFAIFMVQILDFGMGYLKNRLIHWGQWWLIFFCIFHTFIWAEPFLTDFPFKLWLPEKVKWLPWQQDDNSYLSLLKIQKSQLWNVDTSWPFISVARLNWLSWQHKGITISAILGGLTLVSSEKSMNQKQFEWSIFFHNALVILHEYVIDKFLDPSNGCMELCVILIDFNICQ